MNQKEGDPMQTDLQEPYDLMDGATGQVLEVSKEIEWQRKIAADKSYPLDKRIEAYEDIVDSEVGDTSLWQAAIPPEPRKTA